MTAPAPRVLWLAKGLGRGGAEMLLLELARTMPAGAAELHVAYVLPHKDALVGDLRAAGVTVHCLTTGGAGSWVTALRRLIADGRYDVVHSHSPVIGSVARLMVPRGTALVHTEHNVWGRYRRPTRWANAATIHRNDVVWAVSEGVARSIRPWRRGGPAVEVMLHGVRPETIAIGPEARSEARRRLGLPDSTYVVGTVGNLTPKKDHDSLLLAFATFRHRHADSHLVVVGTGPRLEHLVSLAGELGIRDQVTLTGIRDDVPELLAGFDQFAMSSLHEGLSIAVIEAMAAGLPVVATRVGGLPELIVDGEQGLLVPPSDPAALAGALATVADDEALRRRFSEAAVTRAAEFGLQPAADTLTDTYTRLSGLPDAEVAAA